MALRNTSEVAELLVGLFTGDVDLDELDETIAWGSGGVQTFADAGLLTRDAGIVLAAAGGAEFQISIVRSARADGAVCVECGDDFESSTDLMQHLVEGHGYDVDDADMAAADGMIDLLERPAYR